LKPSPKTPTVVYPFNPASQFAHHLVGNCRENASEIHPPRHMRGSLQGGFARAFHIPLQEYVARKEGREMVNLFGLLGLNQRRKNIEAGTAEL